MDKVIKTRINKGGDAVSTSLVINFEGVTQAQLEELAARSIIISTQAAYRTAGQVPAKDTVNVAEVLKHERTAKPKDPLALVAKMSPEQKEELRKLLAAELKATSKK